MKQIYRAVDELDQRMMDHSSIICENDTPYDPEDPRVGLVYHRYVYYNDEGDTICATCEMNLSLLAHDNIETLIN